MKAYEAAPGEASHALRAAELYLEVRDLEAAWRSVRCAIASAPGRRDVRLAAARVLEERGDNAGALLQLMTLAGLGGSDPQLQALIERLSKIIH